MMPKHESRPPEPEPSDSSGWAELERRLRNVRPRPPQLDFVALQRQLQHTAPDAAVPEPITRAVLRDSAWDSRVRLATLAGSWACGAVAGAAFMFLLMNPGSNRQQVLRQNKSPGVGTVSELSDARTGNTGLNSTGPDAQRRAPQSSVPLRRRADPLKSDIRTAAIVLKSWEPVEYTWLSSGPFRAGMHVIGTPADDQRVARVTAGWGPREHSMNDVAGEPGEISVEPTVERSPPATRKRLLDELLRTSPG